MGKVLAEVSGSPHDTASILKIAEAVDEALGQLEKVEQRLEALEKSSKAKKS